MSFFLFILKGSLLDYSQLLTNFDECCDGFVEVFAAVGCRKLYADACLIFRYYRVVETCDLLIFL